MQLFEIGYFSRTHGVKGEVILRTQHDFDLDAIKAVFVEVRGEKVPHFVGSVRLSNNGIIFMLEDIPSIELAKAVLNKPVFIDAALVNETAEDGDLSGYELVDEEFGSLGTVSSVEYNGAQELLVLVFHGREIRLPLVDDFVQEINDAAQVIRYRAPHGLISMQLDSDTTGPGEK